MSKHRGCTSAPKSRQIRFLCYHSYYRPCVVSDKPGLADGPVDKTCQGHAVRSRHVANKFWAVWLFYPHFSVWSPEVPPRLTKSDFRCFKSGQHPQPLSHQHRTAFSPRGSCKSSKPKAIQCSLMVTLTALYRATSHLPCQSSPGTITLTLVALFAYKARAE